MTIYQCPECLGLGGPHVLHLESCSESQELAELPNPTEAELRQIEWQEKTWEMFRGLMAGLRESIFLPRLPG